MWQVFLYFLKHKLLEFELNTFSHTNVLWFIWIYLGKKNWSSVFYFGRILTVSSSQNCFNSATLESFQAWTACFRSYFICMTQLWVHLPAAPLCLMVFLATSASAPIPKPTARPGGHTDRTTTRLWTRSGLNKHRCDVKRCKNEVVNLVTHKKVVQHSDTHLN